MGEIPCWFTSFPPTEKKKKKKKKKWDAKKKLEVKHSNGDLVWVDVAHYNTDQPSKKLLTK